MYSSGRLNFEYLIFPIETEQFFNKYWEKDILYIKRSTQKYYDKIFKLSDLNDYLSRSDIRYPDLRLISNGAELPLDEYSYSYTYGNNVFQGNISIDKVFNLYQNGATINLQLTQRNIKKLSHFSNILEFFLKSKVQINLFLTPAFSQGFTVHYDTHSVIIMQIHGSKTWKIYDKRVNLPLVRDIEYDDEVKINNKYPHKEIILKEGDFLYVPKGVYHEAYTTDEDSLSITIGLHPKSWNDIFHYVIDEISKNCDMMRSSPIQDVINNNFVSLENKFNEIIQYINTYKNIEETFKNLERENFLNQITDNENRLINLINIKHINQYTKVKKNKNIAILQLNDNHISMIFNQKEINFPLTIKEELLFILNQEHDFIINDISNELDNNSKIFLIKLLIKEGYLRVVF